MDRSERVRRIRECARVLNGMPWQEEGLVLTEFGYDWEPHDYASRFAAVLRSLAGNSDENDLRDLHRHLLPDQLVPESESEGQLAAPPGRWPAHRFRLFVSHLSEDKVFIGKLKPHLDNYGVSAFVAHEDIEPTKEWLEEIEIALATCDALLAYLTPNFPKSNFCDQEVGYCVARRVLIVPVRVGLDPYGFIGRYQALQGADIHERALSENIANVLVEHPSTSARMGPGLAQALQLSNTYEFTRATMRLIEKVRSWSPESLRAMEAAAESNDQVSAAVLRDPPTTVPERIRELVKKFGT